MIEQKQYEEASQMKLRDYAALTTGGLVFIASAMAQWIMTQRQIQDVIFIGLMAGFLGAAAFVAATEPKRPRRRKHRARPIQHYEDWRPVFITLDKEAWNRDKKRI